MGKARLPPPPSICPLVLSTCLGDEHMASTFEAERPKWQSDRRTALVSFILSPKPSTLLMIMIALCGAWTLFVAWAAVSLVKVIASS